MSKKHNYDSVMRLTVDKGSAVVEVNFTSSAKDSSKPESKMNCDRDDDGAEIKLNSLLVSESAQD